MLRSPARADPDMQIQLLIPGLLWPAAQTRSPCEGLRLPALAALLGAGSFRLKRATSADQILLSRFGLSPDAAIGPLRRAGERTLDAPVPGHWLCADPVGLHFAREHLLLMDASELAIGDEESAELVAGLNEGFGDIGRFEAGCAERWYLRVDEPPHARFTPLADAVSRPVAYHLPTGNGADDWHRMINEIQVWLHGHPLNRAREADGRQPINSVWPWGAGALEEPSTAPGETIIANGPLALGLGRSAGMRDAAGELRDFGAIGDNTLVCLDEAHQPALYRDLERWQQALRTLERDWFEPALQALRSGRLKRLQLTAAGDRATLELVIDRGLLWPFWKRPRTLEQLIESQP